MILPFIIWGSILLGIFLFFWMLFRLLGFNNIGIILALSNMSIVLIIAILVFNNLKEAQIEFLWFILLVLDFPVSLLYGGFKSIFLNIFGASNIKGTSKNSYFQKRIDSWLNFEKLECPIG